MLSKYHEPSVSVQVDLFELGGAAPASESPGSQSFAFFGGFFLPLSAALIAVPPTEIDAPTERVNPQKARLLSSPSFESLSVVVLRVRRDSPSPSRSGRLLRWLEVVPFSFYVPSSRFSCLLPPRADLLGVLDRPLQDARQIGLRPQPLPKAFFSPEKTLRSWSTVSPQITPYPKQGSPSPQFLSLLGSLSPFSVTRSRRGRRSSTGEAVLEVKLEQIVFNHRPSFAGTCSVSESRARRIFHPATRAASPFPPSSLPKPLVVYALARPLGHALFEQLS